MAIETLRLREDAHVAVIGGGPAGSLFAHFLLAEARAVGLRLNISIYDGKGFNRRGAVGCNQSAGVVARNFADEVRAAGIGLPASVVQRRINGYWLETSVGSVNLKPPGEEEEILTVYRGNGPRGTTYRNNVSLDDHLLDFVRQEGVRVVTEFVTDIRLPSSPYEPCLVAWAGKAKQHWEPADLVVGAFGVNSALAGQVERLGFGYRAPRTVGSIQTELELGHGEVDTLVGDAIGAYSLDLPGVRFAALTPKHDYITVTLVGEAADEERLRLFLKHPVVQRRLGLNGRTPAFACQCRPRVLVSSATRPYDTRIVMVGDAATSRLYKNGLQSSLVTARAAAEVAIRHGVSREAFASHYAKLCRAIDRDNQWGRILFQLYDYTLSRSTWMARRLLSAVEAEQRALPPEERPTCKVLWKMLSGTRPYAEIARDLLRPSLYAHLAQGEGAHK